MVLVWKRSGDHLGEYGSFEIGVAVSSGRRRVGFGLGESRMVVGSGEL